MALTSALSANPEGVSPPSWLQALEEMGDVFWEWEIATGKTSYSRNLNTILKCDIAPHASQELPLIHLVHPEDRAGFESAITLVLQGQCTCFSHTCRLLCGSQDTRWFMCRGKVLKPSAETGSPLLYGTLRDVHEEKAASSDLIEQVNILEGILRHSAHGIISTDIRGTITTINLAAEKMLGYAAEELVGKSTSPLWHEPHAVGAQSAHLSDELKKTIEPGLKVFIAKARLGMVSQHEWNLIRKDGCRFPVFIDVTAIKNESGVVTGYLVSLFDLTERKKIESRLRKSEESLAQKEELFEMAVEIAKVGWWERDLIQDQTYWSPGTCRIFDLDPPLTPSLEEQSRFFDPEHFRCIEQTLRDSIERKIPFEFEYPATTAAGRRIWTKSHGQVILKNGKPIKVLGAFQDITVRKENENAIQQTLERLSLACKAGGIGIWEYVKHSDTLLWDDQMFVLNGIKSENFSSNFQALISSIHPDDRARCAAEFDAAFASDTSFNTEYRVIWPDGSVHHIRALAKVIRNGEGRVQTMVGTNWDITDRKQAEEELERAKIKAISSSRAKAEFLASMSHEIRTPMNGVLGITQLLAETELNAEQREMVRTIQTSGDALLTILNDILDFSKIEAGKLHIEKLPFDLTQTLGSIVELLSLPARKKGLDIRLEYAEDLPARIISDPSRIRQVIFNLLGNAVKFTHHGGISISAMRNRETLRISVRDTGIGIPEAKHSLIFQQFSQADASTSRKFGGTGLGLAISKRLMELMGGDIGFVSEFGKGSEFWVELPLIAAAASPGPKAVVPSLQDKFPSWTAVADSIAKHHILLVEDNPVNQKVTLGMLKKMNCSFDLAQNGFEAVEKAFSGNYTLILMDCEMPEMDGYEATREIRRREAQRPWVRNRPEHRIIYALTANAMKEDELRCLASGMDGFLTKPVRMRELTQALASKIGARS